MKGIYERRRISLIYDGRSRLVEPYALGISHAQNPVIRVWQISGASSSGEETGWKLLKLDKISSVTVTDAIFQPTRPGYNPNDKGMSRVYHTI